MSQKNKSAFLSFPEILKERPRLFLCTLLGTSLVLLLPASLQIVARILIAWNSAVITYIILVVLMAYNAPPHKIRQQARFQAEGRSALLCLALIAALASLGAIIWQLAGVKEYSGITRYMHIGLAFLTIVSSFTFIHLIFLLFYAHEYYTDIVGEDGNIGIKQGLLFPKTPDPDYSDFAYFSYVIGVASQTADVGISSGSMRTTALAHGIVAFTFNTAVLALMINIAASLIQG